MSHLSTAQSAGQVIVAGFAEQGPSASLQTLAQAGQLGGFILFRRNLHLREPREIAEQNQRLRNLIPGDIAPWISVDQEGGRVARLGPPVVTLPPMRELGQIDDPALTEAAAFLLGRQLAALGFNLDFAPVLDVDTNPDNPVISDRSFGTEPDVVVRHARAFAVGLGRAGIASCGKHFPGHGDTETDSHRTLPRLRHTRERLNAIELAPFAALSRELPCIMSAHVLFELIDPDRPATLSPALIDGLLRTELGFEGLVFGDDLEMKAVSVQYGIPTAACMALAAGCDQLLICEHEDLVLETHEALIHTAERDSAFAQRLEAAAHKARALRTQFTLETCETMEPARVAAYVASELQEEVSLLQQRIADARAGIPNV